MNEQQFGIQNFVIGLSTPKLDSFIGAIGFSKNGLLSDCEFDQKSFKSSVP